MDRVLIKTIPEEVPSNKTAPSFRPSEETHGNGCSFTTKSNIGCQETELSSNTGIGAVVPDGMMGNGDHTSQPNAEEFHCTDSPSTDRKGAVKEESKLVSCGTQTDAVSPALVNSLRPFTQVSEVSPNEEDVDAVDSATKESDNIDTQVPRPNRFTCEICGKEYNCNAFLKSHMQSHCKIKPFQCTVCTNTYSRKATLKVHMLKHTGEKPHICGDCGKAFATKANLVIHRRIHTGEKPYSCKVCGKRFVQHSSLNSHKNIHKGVRPHACEKCGKRFARKHDINQHMTVHTGEKPFSCDVCNKAFARKSLLVIHKRIHTGERPYPCEECGKRFVQRSQYIQHKTVHTGDRPYKCIICGKGYLRKNEMTKHLKTHSQPLIDAAKQQNEDGNSNFSSNGILTGNNGWIISTESANSALHLGQADIQV